MSRPLGSGSPPALPTGNVTFLFTDIEGSTRLWERAPDAMRRGLARHDEILNKNIGRNGGIVFKTVGDSFFAVFERPENALRAATDIQYALLNEPWPQLLGRLFVRMGLYSGTPELRGRDYFGPTVNRVARLTAAANGGQILVSAATAELAADKLGNIKLHDLGMHRLRDLTDPERIFQVVAPGLPTELKPPASVDASPNNLPAQISTFVGRAADRKKLKQLLRSHPLVTIAGLGGIGKTRLALEVANELLGGFTGGCWFVSLKEVEDPMQIARATADALRLRGLPGDPIEETLVEHLLLVRTLIVIDNAEHLIAGAAIFIRRLLERVSRLRIVVTSREPLHVIGEQVLRIGALEEAASLFLDRVRSQGVQLEESPETTPAIANICNKLQGIPLAVELAAARIGTMHVNELDQILSSKIQLLLVPNADNADGGPLDAMLDWSYRLLKPAERRFLMRLAIFDGSFALEAAEAVAGDGQRGEALGLLGSLSDKSLVAFSTDAGVSRYYLLDVVRTFALERLRRSEDATSYHKRHATYFFGLLQSLTAPGVSGELSVARLTAEWSNIRSALRFALEEGHDPEAGHWAVRRLYQFWTSTGRGSEGWYWVNRALQETDVPPKLRAELLQRASQIAWMRQDVDSVDALSKLLVEIHEQSGDPVALGLALLSSANAKVGQGSGAEAEQELLRSLQEFRAADDRQGIALALANLGTIAGQQHRNHDAARKLLLHSLEMLQDLDAPLACAQVLGNLSVASMSAGDRTQALAYSRQSLDILERLGNQAEAGLQHINIAEIYTETGALTAASCALLDARRAFGERPNPVYVAYYFEAAFKLAVELAEYEAATRIYGYADRHRRKTRSPLHPSERAAIDSCLARLTRAIGTAEVDRLATLGKSMSEAEMEGVIASLSDVPPASLAPH